MKIYILLLFSILNTVQLLAQDQKIEQLVSAGTELHDKGKYEEAIARYKEALGIDKNSSLANYEISYTYLTMGKYDEAIKYSRKVIEQKAGQLEHAYIVLGSSLDMMGKSREAIRAYEEGLVKFPGSNLLNYNLALTAYNSGDLQKAEAAAIQAVLSKPSHAGSHLVLASVMQDKGERVKSLLPLYYALMIEPDSKRSLSIYKILRTMLDQGIEKKTDNEVQINISYSSLKDSLFGPADTFLSLLSASKDMESNKEKNDFEIFAGTNKSFFSVLGGLKKENKGMWWDLYVSKFEDLVHSNNWEAFSYYISQSVNSEAVNNWINYNQSKMQVFQEWLKK